MSSLNDLYGGSHKTGLGFPAVTRENMKDIEIQKGAGSVSASASPSSDPVLNTTLSPSPSSASARCPPLPRENKHRKPYCLPWNASSSGGQSKSCDISSASFAHVASFRQDSSGAHTVSSIARTKKRMRHREEDTVSTSLIQKPKKQKPSQSGSRDFPTTPMS